MDFIVHDSHIIHLNDNVKEIKISGKFIDVEYYDKNSTIYLEFDSEASAQEAYNTLLHRLANFTTNHMMHI